jgi:putative transposase
VAGRAAGLIRWGGIGVFDRILAALTGESAATDIVLIDAMHSRPPGTAASLLKKGQFPGQA